jgi:hypothetical protein
MASKELKFMSRMVWYFLPLLCCGILSCQQGEGSGERAEVLHSAQLVFLSRPPSAWDGSSNIELDTLDGRWANASTLFQIEQALLGGARTSYRWHYLNGTAESPRYSMRVQYGIFCRMKDGRSIHLSGPSAGTEWMVGGEHGYFLNLPKELSETLGDPSRWTGPEPEPLKRTTVPYELTIPRDTAIFKEGGLKSSLLHDPEEEPVRLKSALRYRSIHGMPSEDSEGTSNLSIFLGQAREKALSALEEVLHGWRCSTLQFLPNGQVLNSLPEGPATEWIDCTMEDGQKLRVQVFSAEGPWVVAGEEPFRLYVDGSDARAVFNPLGWSTDT